MADQKDRTLTGASTPSLVGQKIGRTRNNLKIGEDGTVTRVAEDTSTIQARIQANSTMSNEANMAALATTGNLENPEENRPPTVKTISATDPPPSVATPNSAPVSAVARARLVPRTYTAGFGKGLEIDSYSIPNNGEDDKGKEDDNNQEEEEEIEQALVL